MQPSNREALHTFLVDAFNRILHQEEAALRAAGWQDLSLRELHDLAAIGQPQGRHSMKEIAARLQVTTGSLTVAVAALERKGYVVRRRDDQDRRRVLTVLTALGQEAYDWHEAYHHELVDFVIRHLSSPDIASLVRSLDVIQTFFVESASAGTV